MSQSLTVSALRTVFITAQFAMFIHQRQLLDTGIPGTQSLQFLYFRPQFELKAIKEFQPFFFPFVLNAEHELRACVRLDKYSNTGDRIAKAITLFFITYSLLH